VSELIQSDYLAITGKDKNEAIDWLKKEWDATTYGETQTDDDKDKKSSGRLTGRVGGHDKVAEIRLFTTVNGIKFIEEYRRFRRFYVYNFISNLINLLIGIILGTLLK